MAKILAAVIQAVANGGWHLFQVFNRLIPEGRPPILNGHRGRCLKIAIEA